MIMAENPENAGASETESAQDLSYDEITESSVADLFARFKKMRSEDRINEVSAFCLATALSNTSKVKNEDTRLEYLKEYGRNERTMLKSDSVGGNDEDDPIFEK